MSPNHSSAYAMLGHSMTLTRGCEQFAEGWYDPFCELVPLK